MRITELVKGDVLALDSSCTVQEAAVAMHAKKCGAVVIMEGGKLAGIFSERDLLNRVVAMSLDPRALKLNDVMTKNVLTIGLASPAEEALRIMYKKRLRHLPVVDEAGNPVGMLGLRDLTDFIVRGLYGES